MIEKILAWDIETAKIVPEGEDLDDHHPLGISIAATLTDGGDLKLWYGGDQMSPSLCRELAQYLWGMHFVQGYTIVGFNSASFDFRVLAEESGMIKTCQKLALNHIDFGFHFFAEKGFMPSLQSIALGMELKGKSGEGKDAPRMWAEGQRNEILGYVAQDVRVTLDVFQEIQKRGYVEWITKKGNLGTWYPRTGKLLIVREAMKLPEPDISWMKKTCLGCGRSVYGNAYMCPDPDCEGVEFEGGPWPRSKFTDWLVNRPIPVPNVKGWEY